MRSPNHDAVLVLQVTLLKRVAASLKCAVARPQVATCAFRASNLDTLLLLLVQDIGCAYT